MNIIETNLTWNGQLSLTNVPQLIVDHHAEATTCTIEDIDRWHKERGWLGCGYHFFVRKDGSIYRGRPENAEGAHCYGYNVNSIGICFEGNYMTDDMPQAQKQAGIELHKYLMQKYNISRIEPHRALYNTSCPGDKFPFDEIKNASLLTQLSVVNYQPIQNRTWLQVGDTGDKVTDLQSKLSRLGYGIAVTGTYDKATKNVVYKFQADNSLTQDGLAGNETFNCLNAKITEISFSPVIKSFQHVLNVIGIKDNNNNPLAEDGDMGTHTSDAIAKVPLLQRGAAGELVKWIQQRLTDLGFSCGQIDGVFGYKTLSAVQNFQASRHLKTDGIIGQITLNELLK